jgi:hypothetical protein
MPMLQQGNAITCGATLARTTVTVVTVPLTSTALTVASTLMISCVSAATVTQVTAYVIALMVRPDRHRG